MNTANSSPRALLVAEIRRSATCLRAAVRAARAGGVAAPGRPADASLTALFAGAAALERSRTVHDEDPLDLQLMASVAAALVHLEDSFRAHAIPWPSEAMVVPAHQRSPILERSRGPWVPRAAA